MPPGPAGNREREILTAIVETFIATGEPVGSRTLARSSREGLSPATIRNVMADLADAGFLEQPHTSAGRVPSAEAYRYYVEQISGKARISEADQDKISGSFQGISDPEEFLERTSHVLCLISSGVGVAVGAPQGSKNQLEHVYFSRLAANKVLAVVVTKAGVVRDRVLRMERDLNQQTIRVWPQRWATSACLPGPAGAAGGGCVLRDRGASQRGAGRGKEAGDGLAGLRHERPGADVAAGGVGLPGAVPGRG